MYVPCFSYNTACSARSRGWTRTLSKRSFVSWAYKRKYRHWGALFPAQEATGKVTLSNRNASARRCSKTLRASTPKNTRLIYSSVGKYLKAIKISLKIMRHYPYLLKQWFQFCLWLDNCCVMEANRSVGVSDLKDFLNCDLLTTNVFLFQYRFPAIIYL